MRFVKHNKGKLLFIMYWIFHLIDLTAQDPSFSQFYANRLYLNPSWAGIEDGKRFFLNYRNQYSNSYITYSASYDQYVEPLHGGLGVSIMNDVQGPGYLNILNLSAIYSYHIKVSRFLSVNAGLQTSFFQRKLNASKFIFEDQIDPVTGGINPGSENYGDFKKDFPDFSTGFAAFYKNLYSGISMFHLFRPVQSINSGTDARLPRKFIFYMGGCFPVYEKRLGKEVLQLNPNLIYLQQKNLNQLNYGLELLFANRLAAGFLVRQNLGLSYSSLIFSAGIALDKFRFRYSFDTQLSLPSVNFTTSGAHELSLIVAIDEEKKIKRKAIKCPKF